MLFYYPWLCLRARSLVFFSASNPGITMGGMFGESKFEVLKKVPQHIIPKTLLIQLPITKTSLIELLEKENLPFPVIFKPDIGERGFMVKRINSEEDLAQYLQKTKVDFLVQELVDLPLEFGVFYTRYPSASHGQVNSIVMKEMLSITGNGKSTLRDLILTTDRAKLQWQSLEVAYRQALDNIVPLNQKIELVSIGNHALGTKFINANSLITPGLSSSFDQISKQIDGFYFGRFDLRCASVQDLEKGNVKIVELNGCGAEPAHIYDPAFNFFDAVKVLLQHWRNIFEISRENNQRGVPYISFKEGLAFYTKFKSATR